jgi:hypothetical protein
MMTKKYSVNNIKKFNGIGFKIELDSWNFGDGMTKGQAQELKQIIKHRNKSVLVRTIPAINIVGNVFVYSTKNV